MTCDHCKTEIASGMAVLVSMQIVIYSAMIEEPVKHSLCGACSFELAEYLCPSLRESERFQTDKREVLGKLAAERN
jgi:hypothetical protein